MAASQQGSWILLPQPLSESYAIDLLGRVVASSNNPEHNFVPLLTTTTMPALEKIEVQDESAVVYLNGNHKADVKARLTSLLHVGSTNATSSSRIVSSTSIITRLLSQHTTHFNELKKLYSPEITQLINDKRHIKSDDSRTVYLVVGTKTCLDAQVGSSDMDDVVREGGIQVPVEAILNASGVPIPSLPALDVGVDATRQRTTNALQMRTAKGERLFALQCRQIKTHKSWRYWSKPPELQVLGMKDGVFKTSKPSNSDDSGDSESDDTDDDVDSTIEAQSTSLDDEELELEMERAGKPKGTLFEIV
ncbi:hypothetical protein HYFRA_00012521 [Hymenoscyphus fraxineus]|uniref:Uncharacterized protein n=1 Tax=Hymenoscyphus fraxineus TaxID=746836 RepID=A0A9N9KYZ6_9HELO|nr:hypothetical protein HYFRA_00012521 [Hymenoscyphus fraxineus]